MPVNAVHYSKVYVQDCIVLSKQQIRQVQARLRNCILKCLQVQAAATTAISRCKAGMPLRKLWTAASPPLNSIDNTYT